MSSSIVFAPWMTQEFGGNDVHLYQKSRPELYEQNIDARKQIVDALGGLEGFQKIPSVVYPILHPQGATEPIEDPPATANMFELEGICFPKGASMVRTIDPFGRLAFVIQLVDRRHPDAVKIERIFQRRRETCIRPNLRAQDGSRWVSKILAPGYGAEEIADELTLLVKGTHPKYQIKSPEPKSTEYTTGINYWSIL